jgi:ribA/ribD-fused uncharacterized protein
MGDIYFYSHNKPYGELSNFWRSPFVLDGLEWPTVEHYFQAQKTTDLAKRERIRKAQTPALAKQLGHSVCSCPDWKEVKEDIMLKALRAKFSQNPDLAEVLLDTGDNRLHEDSPHDQYWGVKGKDRLGKLLEQVREEIRREQSFGANAVYR